MEETIVLMLMVDEGVLLSMSMILLIFPPLLAVVMLPTELSRLSPVIGFCVVVFNSDVLEHAE